jgi:hypothetical protein
MNMVDVTLVIRTLTGVFKVGKVEINKYATVDEVLKYLHKEIKDTKLDPLDWQIDFTKNYTLSISPTKNSCYLDDVGLTNGCYVYMQEIPSELIVKIK